MSNSSGLGLAVAAVGAIAGAIASVPAVAGPVSVSHSVSLNTLMQGSGSTLNFDLNNFLSSQGYTASEVVGGSVSVFGFSEASYGSPQYGNDYNTTTYMSGSHNAWYSYYVQGYQYCGWWSGCYYSGGYTAWASYSVYDYNQVSDRDVIHNDNVADQMRVVVGGTVATDTAATHSNSTGSFGSYLYDSTTGTGCWGDQCSHTTVYHRERDVYTAVYGALDVTETLDLTALLDLKTDGVLGLGISAPVGKFSLNAVSFDLLVQHEFAQALKAVPANAVPEPPNLALTLLALAAAAVAGRLHRGRKAQQR